MKKIRAHAAPASVSEYTRQIASASGLSHLLFKEREARRNGESVKPRKEPAVKTPPTKLVYHGGGEIRIGRKTEPSPITPEKIRTRREVPTVCVCGGNIEPPKPFKGFEGDRWLRKMLKRDRRLIVFKDRHRAKLTPHADRRLARCNAEAMRVTLLTEVAS